MVVYPRKPYRVSVEVLQNDGSTPRANATLSLTNNSTGESVTFSCDANGRGVYDLANLSKGYQIGDNIEVKQTKDHSDMEYFVCANGDQTYKNWIQIENNISFDIISNMRRFKINTERNPGGITINITRDV